MSVKMEMKEQTCTVCSKVFGSDSITAAESVIDLFEFLVETIDTSALQNALICTACLEKLNNAVNFKMSLLVKQETSNEEIKQETDCDEKFIVCYICKNFTKIDSAQYLFNSYYKNIVSYMIPKRNLDIPDNLRICDGCHTSLLNFQNMKLFLSVYDLNRGNIDQPNIETVSGESELKLNLIDNCVPEDNKLNVELKRNIKQEIEVPEEYLQIKQEELDLKMDCEEGPSSAGFWTLNNEDQERSSTLPCPENESDLTTSTSKIEMDYELSSDNLKPKMFKCDNCDYQTKRKIHFKTHLLIHKNINEITMYKCQICEFQTKRKENLKNHILIHKSINEVAMFKCHNCDFQTKRKSSLKVHVLIHKNINEVKMFKCQNCEFQTKYSRNLTTHMLTHKNMNEVIMFKCQNCEFQTKHKPALKFHELIHKNINEIKMFTCPDCGIQTKYKNNLRKHSLVHKSINEIVMFKCQYCVFQTKRKSDLKKHCLKLHLLIHKNINEPKKFKCPDCGFQTKYKHSLKKHVLVHKSINEVEMFKCQYCNYQTKRKYDLKKHVLIHKNVQMSNL